MNLKIQIELESDTTFGRGDGVAGLIDMEVEHDEIGLPFLRGRALKGLLAEECANILFSIEHCANQKFTHWETISNNLFGTGGSDLIGSSGMHVGDAVLPNELKLALEFEIFENKSITADEVLDSLTSIRRQTAIDANGSPKETSLRASRVILRTTVFESEIEMRCAEDSDEVLLLAVCCMALQRAGLGRNRGGGKIKAVLLNGALPIAHSLQTFLDKI